MNQPPPNCSDGDFARLGPIVLVGHRGAGKGTLGRAVASRLNRNWVDMDRELVAGWGIVYDDDPDQFRAQEQRLHSQLCQRQPPPIISCGGGLESIDPRAFVVWIDRQDWRDEVANSGRPRVRPDLSEREEWDWMERTRPPRWRRAAHLRLPVPRGRSVERSADQLATLLRWSASVAHSPRADKCWLVPAARDDYRRAVRDARRFGFAGIEIRSDVFGDRPPDLDAIDYIASLRHGQARWLDQFSDAQAWDIDCEFVAAARHASFESVPGRILVSAHPDRIESDASRRLAAAADDLAGAWTLRDERLELKYAPEIGDFEQAARLLDLAPRIRRAADRTTIVPTSRNFAWLRFFFAPENAADYLPIGLHQRTPDHPSPTDFQTCLPHLAGPPPERFDALVGHPVDHSQGLWWHRHRALCDESSPTSYLRIPVKRSTLDDALEVLERLPIRGLSVTSPLKRQAAQSERIDSPTPLRAINTLRRTSGDAQPPWEGTDTDIDGMCASLEYFEQQGIGPGNAIVFGRGGASHAVVRGLEERGWDLVEHISARRGWQPAHRALQPVDLVVHAAGPDARRSEYTPRCRAWLDLHYRNVAPPPPETVHLQGDHFFDAQARAQRLFWSRTDEPE